MIHTCADSTILHLCNVCKIDVTDQFVTGSEYLVCIVVYVDSLIPVDKNIPKFNQEKDKMMYSSLYVIQQLFVMVVFRIMGSHDQLVLHL